MIRLMLYLLLLVGLLMFLSAFLANLGIPGLEDIHQVETHISSTPHVIRELQKLGELHTAIGSIQTVLTGERHRKVLWVVPSGNTQLLLIAHAEIRAGIDLGAITADHIEEQESQIRIRLPPATILDAKLDVERTRIYDIRQSMMLSPEPATLHEDMLREALMRSTEAALETELLHYAETNAIALIEGLFATLPQSVQVIPHEDI